jgi:hypothetical protein
MELRGHRAEEALSKVLIEEWQQVISHPLLELVLVPSEVVRVARQ